MKVEISYFPKEKVVNVSGPEATFPFDIDGGFKYVVDFFLQDKKRLAARTNLIIY